LNNKINYFKGLIEGEGKMQLDLIAKYYALWLLSNPFDRGNTITNALLETSKKNVNKNWDL
jgi:hypothetical protein